VSDIFPKGSAGMDEKFIQLSEAKIPTDPDWSTSINDILL